MARDMEKKKARDAEYRARNRDKAVARARKWREDNPERTKALHRARYLAMRDQIRDTNLRKKYRIPLVAYEAMLENQGGVCAICFGAQIKGKSMCVDHDHETGSVRSLLCDSCNNGLGRFKDSPRLLRLAIAYLEKHGCL